jgi:hypothetical protein
LKIQHVLSGIPLIIRSSKLFVASSLYTHVVTGRCPDCVGTVPTQPGQRPFTKWLYKPEAANRVCSSWWWAVCRLKHVRPSNKFWSNKCYYKVATCWLFLLIHTAIHGSMNIKSISTSHKVFLFPFLRTFAIFFSCCTFEGFVSSSNTLTTSLNCGYEIYNILIILYPAFISSNFLATVR